MSLGATLAVPGGPRPTSFLPSIKCSQCGDDIQVADMADHACAQLPQQPHSNKPRSLSNPFVLRQYNASGQKPPFPSPLSQTQGASDMRPDRPLPRSARTAPPRINPDLANRSFSAGPPSQALGPAGGRAVPIRSATSPMPRLWNMRPPSEELSANLDCAFPPFPAPFTTESRPGSASGSDRGESGSRSRSAKNYNDPPRIRADEPQYPPMPVRRDGGEAVIKRSNTMTRGPFAKRRQPSTESKSAQAPAPAPETQTRSSQAEEPPQSQHQARASAASSVYSEYPLPSRSQSIHEPTGSALLASSPVEPSLPVLRPEVFEVHAEQPLQNAEGPITARNHHQAGSPQIEGDQDLAGRDIGVVLTASRSITSEMQSPTLGTGSANFADSFVSRPPNHESSRASMDAPSESGESTTSSSDRSVGHSHSDRSAGAISSVASSVDAFSPLGYAAGHSKDDDQTASPHDSPRRGELAVREQETSGAPRSREPSPNTREPAPLGLQGGLSTSPRAAADWPLASPVEARPSGVTGAEPHEQRHGTPTLNADFLSVDAARASPGGADYDPYRAVSPVRAPIPQPPRERQHHAQPTQGRPHAKTGNGTNTPPPTMTPLLGAPGPRSRPPPLRPQQHPGPMRQQSMPTQNRPHMPQPVQPHGLGLGIGPNGPPPRMYPTPAPHQQRGPGPNPHMQGRPPPPSFSQRHPPPRSPRSMAPLQTRTPPQAMSPPLASPSQFSSTPALSPSMSMSPALSAAPPTTPRDAGQAPFASRSPSLIGGKYACRGCGLAIEGKSVKAADGRLTGRWHKACFTCRTCRQAFTTADFYVLADQPYCEQHYHEANGSVCRGCTRGIEGPYVDAALGGGSSGSLLQRHKFHPRCFTCDDCRSVLADDYFDIAGRVFCERHAMARMRSRAAGPTGSPVIPSSPSAALIPSNLRAERRTTRLIMT